VAVFAINAFTYLASQLSLLWVPSLGPDKTDGFPNVARIAKDITIGFRFMLGDSCMRTITLMSLCLNTFGWIGMAAAVPFLKRDFGVSDQLVGVFYGIGNVACAVGSLYAGRMSDRWAFGRALTVAYILDGLVALPIPFTHSYWIVVLFAALANGVAQFEITQIVGWRLRVTPNEMVGAFLVQCASWHLVESSPVQSSAASLQIITARGSRCSFQRLATSPSLRSRLEVAPLELKVGRVVPKAMLRQAQHDTVKARHDTAENVLRLSCLLELSLC